MRRVVVTLCLVASVGACSRSPEIERRAVPTSIITTSTAAPTTTMPPPVRDDASDLGRAIVAAESAIRDTATPGAALVEQGRAQQVAYRTLVEHPEWLTRVLEIAPAALHGAIHANFDAGSKLRSATPPQHAAPPAIWRIVAPAPADELLGYYRAAEAEFGVPWAYLAGVHLVETRMGRIRGESSAGAQGPMQFLPSTWAAYGEGDINSNRDAIRAAARYLKRNGAPADMRNALWNYNHSFRYVDAVTAYAEQMRGNERAYFGYYQWQVFYRTTGGDVLLAEGYGS